MTGRRSPAEIDICVLGLGAVGALVARGTAKGGRKVVALEAGPPRTGREAAMDEMMSSMIRNEFGEPKFNHEVPTWRVNADSPRRPMEPYPRDELNAHDAGTGSADRPPHGAFGLSRS